MIKFMTNGEIVRDAVSPKAITSVLDTFFNDAIRNSGGAALFRPNADILENDTQYEIRLSLPGYSKDEISLELKVNKLTVSRKKVADNEAPEAEVKPEKFIVREIFAGDFSRTFTLPENADKEKINAGFKDGILSIKIEKTDPKAGVKSIEIK